HKAQCVEHRADGPRQLDAMCITVAEAEQPNQCSDRPRPTQRVSDDDGAAQDQHRRIYPQLRPRQDDCRMPRMAPVVMAPTNTIGRRQRLWPPSWTLTTPTLIMASR